ncbi:uncharacterized protein LOC134811707 [Bolinopsis microptera]|uniref:uncharacterized protein LOC134811707 n=1 Tax=Bolinopsis microptera TaxID=2820187 RepID=UPI003079291C
MPCVLLVLLAIFSDLFKGTSSTEMDCTAVDAVYNRIKDSIKSTPMYQILRNKETSLCHRSTDITSSTYTVYSATCCSFDKEIALALTSSTLFRQYLYTDSLQGYKYALDDIVLHYKSEIGKVLDPDLREYVIKYIQRFGSDNSLMEQIIKEQLRIYLQRREMFEVPFIQEKCFYAAKRFAQTFELYLKEYLERLAALQEGIYLAIKLMDALQNQKVSPKCVEAVTRSSVMTIGCNQCEVGSANFKTCRSLCSNVVNGCMKPLLPLLPTWYEWLKTMDSLDFSLNKKSDTLLDENISQKLYDSFTLDYHNLSENCNINRSSSNAISRTPRNYWRLSDGGGSVDSHPLYQDMFSAMFDDLQAKFCRGLDLAAESDSFPCWNGTHVASYTRNLTYFNQESQELNPEVEDNSFIHFTAQRAISDLKNFNLRYRSYRADEKDDKLSTESVPTRPKTLEYNVTPTVPAKGCSSCNRPSKIIISFLLVLCVNLFSRHRWLSILVI